MRWGRRRPLHPGSMTRCAPAPGPTRTRPGPPPGPAIRDHAVAGAAAGGAGGPDAHGLPLQLPVAVEPVGANSSLRRPRGTARRWPPSAGLVIGVGGDVGRRRGRRRRSCRRSSPPRCGPSGRPRRGGRRAGGWGSRPSGPRREGRRAGGRWPWRRSSTASGLDGVAGVASAFQSMRVFSPWQSVQASALSLVETCGRAASASRWARSRTSRCRDLRGFRAEAERPVQSKVVQYPSLPPVTGGRG